MKILTFVFHRIHPVMRLGGFPIWQGFSIYKVLFSVPLAYLKSVIFKEKRNGRIELSKVLGVSFCDGETQKNRATLKLATRSVMSLVGFFKCLSPLQDADVLAYGQREYSHYSKLTTILN